jgi:ribosomal protein S18 acetylase RimI-like enzyme
MPTQTDNMTIKLMAESDFESFSTLRIQALQELPTSFGADYEEFKLLDRAEVSKHLASNDEQFAIGAFSADLDLVGFVGFFRSKGKKSRHHGTIWGVYVLPELRGLGISRQLMVAAIKRAQEIPDLEHLNLTVATSNDPAKKLYKSLGFEQYGIEPATLKVDGKAVDGSLMQLKLYQK